MPGGQLALLPRMGRLDVLLFGLATGCATGVDFVATSMLSTGALHIRAGIYASPDDFLWCLTAYAGAAIIANLVLRRVADWIGYRDLTLLGLTIAIVGSLLCALSNNVVELSLALAVHGLGSGGLLSASRTLIQIVAEPLERRALLWPFLLGALGLSAAAPWVTAALMLDAGWRMIFVLQAITCALTWLLVAATYPHCVKPPATPDLDTIAKMDWFTVLELGAGALTLVHGLADLRIYMTSNSVGVLMWPAVGALLMIFAFIRQHRHPDPWLNTRSLNGRRYLTGLAYYAIFSLFGGLWGYLIPNLLQSGLGFTFETTGRFLTISSAAGVLAAVIYILYGASLPGSRRYLALGYLMTAGAAWLLATRTMTGLSMEHIVPILLMQSAALPFTLALVAKLTFMETPLADFAHAYQFKNIVRQIALTAGTGLAAQCLQYGEIMARTSLVGHINDFTMPNASVIALTTISHQIDQQAVLVATANLMAIAAPACLLVAIAATLQRWLR